LQGEIRKLAKAVEDAGIAHKDVEFSKRLDGLVQCQLVTGGQADVCRDRNDAISELLLKAGQRCGIDIDDARAAAFLNKRLTTARPIPLAPPVTSATWSVSALTRLQPLSADKSARRVLRWRRSIPP